MYRIVVLTAAMFVLAVTTLAGSAPTANHDVILIASAQDWSDANGAYPASIYACTRSQNAPPCPVGANSAQVAADLLSAGYHPDPTLSPLIAFGVAWVR